MKTPQQLRDIALAIEADERGEPIEFLLVSGCDSEWRPCTAPRWADDVLYRPKPKPVTRPWDFNSRPREVVWVFRKGYITDSMIVAWGDDYVGIGHKELIYKLSYQELFYNYKQRDGSVCGVTEPA